MGIKAEMMAIKAEMMATAAKKMVSGIHGHFRCPLLLVLVLPPSSSSLPRYMCRKPHQNS